MEDLIRDWATEYRTSRTTVDTLGSIFHYFLSCYFYLFSFYSFICLSITDFTFVFHFTSFSFAFFSLNNILSVSLIFIKVPQELNTRTMICAGDEILSVNRVVMQGLTHRQASTVFKRIKKGQVICCVARRIKENHFIK